MTNKNTLHSIQLPVIHHPLTLSSTHTPIITHTLNNSFYIITYLFLHNINIIWDDVFLPQHSYCFLLYKILIDIQRTLHVPVSLFQTITFSWNLIVTHVMSTCPNHLHSFTYDDDDDICATMCVICWICMMMMEGCCCYWYTWWWYWCWWWHALIKIETSDINKKIIYFTSMEVEKYFSCHLENCYLRIRNI